MVNQQHADEVSIACIVQMYERVKFKNCGKLPTLSPKQILNLRKTWAKFAKGDNDTAGLNMFLQMFSAHPNIKRHFEFEKASASEKMVSSSRMLFHVSRVAYHINNTLDHLENLEDVVPTLKQIGGRHVSYSIPGDELPLLGEALIVEIKKCTTLTSDDVAAWKAIFGWIVDQMKAGMADVQKMKGKC